MAAALLVALSGCGAEESSPDTEAAAVRAQMAWDSAQRQYEEVQEIERRLVRGCLTKQGFEIFPKESAPPKKSTDSQRTSTDPVQAARIGYGYDPRRQPSPDAKANDSEYAKTPDSYKGKLTLAKYGPSTDTVSFTTPDGTNVDIPRAGCVGDIRTALYGDLKEFLRLSFTAENLVRMDASRDIEKNPKVLALVDPWRDCVKTAGYPGIQFPRDMRDKAKGLYKGIDRNDEKALDAAAANEIKIATAEATCTKSVGLDEAVAAARAEGSVKSLAKYEADMVAWNAMALKALAKAQEMLKA
ncbi:hypothetical protein KBX06_04810 [Micromonospora sp. C31]|uniref:hypothetical protein n=1 Tax=Micromonospora sp. C31 TaxID=2824876 RepID=UPI001B35A375|nr:hypothetical protein [Micromonospora sp. C31]MBQ1072491.1 hypothetical protein [Micromonospora sp. C31]